MSKRILQHPEVPAGETTVSWGSLGQLEDTPAFRQWLEREFPQGAAEMSGEGDLDTSRRSFLKLMGASTALAGLGMAACRRPESFIEPFAKAPEWVIPGKALYYASSMPRSGGATPLVVTTFEGRPTKVAPNTLHPDGDGTDAFAQASVLDLYSPSRSRGFLKSGKAIARTDFEAALAAVAKDKSAKIGFVFGSDDSPTRARLAKQLAGKFAAAKFYQYEALAGESVVGDGVSLVPDFAKADRIVSLDCDFVGVDAVYPTAAFSARRKPEGTDYKGEPDASKMNRLYAVEGAYSLTGGMADHRLRVAPSQVAAVAAQLAGTLGAGGSTAAILDEKQTKWIIEMAADLKEFAGKSVVLAGPRQPAVVHQLALAINQVLGNIGEGKPLQAYKTGNAGLGTLAGLTKDLESGAIDTVMLLTPSNPVFDAPADLKFADALAKAKVSIHLGQRTDASAHAAGWHVPAAHYLEQWSDARSANGVYTIVQPMILPLYPDCVSELELLLALLSDDGKLLNGEGEKGAASPAYAAVRETFAGLADKEDASWKKLLRDGFLAGSKYQPASPKAQAPVFAKTEAPTAKSLEIVFATDSSVYDGRWIDNGWLQEVPDPVSKLSWDNAALIAPKTAKELGIYDEILELESNRASVHPDGESGNRKAPLIKVTVNGRSVEVPVLVAFGQAENVIVLPVGYGQGCDKEDELKRDTAKAATSASSASTAASTSTRCAPPPPPISPPAAPPRRPANATRSPSARSTPPCMAARSPARSRPRPTRRRAISPPRSPASPSRAVTATRRRTSRSTSRRTTRASRCSATRSTSGRWRSTSPPAPVATPASSPASRKTTSRSSASASSPWAARCTGSAWTAISRSTRRTTSTRTARNSCPSRSPACSARTPRAKPSVRSTPPSIPRTDSTRWPTTAASAPATARTTARTRPAASTTSTTTSATRWSPTTSTADRSARSRSARRRTSSATRTSPSACAA